MSTDEPVTAPPNSGWLPYLRLRTLASFVAIAIILLLGPRIVWAIRVQGIIYQLRESGATVYTDGNAVDRFIWNPPILYVDSAGAAISDDDLRLLRHLPSFTHLYLDNSGVADRSLEFVSNLRRLEVLRLRNTRVTDAGLAHLKGLSDLAYLDLAETRATDAGVDDLKCALPGLTVNR